MFEKVAAHGGARLLADGPRPWSARAWDATLGRLGMRWGAVLGLGLIVLGALGGGAFAEFTLAVAPSFWRVFVSALIFALSGVVGAALLGVLVMDWLADRGRTAAYAGFWIPLAAFVLPGILTVASGWNVPTVQPSVVSGSLAGDAVWALVAWAAFRSGVSRM